MEPSKPVHEVEVVIRFTVDEDAWATEYGVFPADVPRDISDLLSALALRKAIESARVFGPLVKKLDSVKIRVGIGPRARFTES